MPKISSRSLAISSMIERQEAFQTHGSFWAASGPCLGSGYLAGIELDAWRADKNDIVYSVYSYNTPIYWVTAAGKKHRVKQKFSVTTSRHQGKLPLVS